MLEILQKSLNSFQNNIITMTNKQGMISNTFYLIVSKLIPALLLTLINVIFSRKLSFSDYGAYQTVWSITNVCIIIVTFGIPRYIMSFGNIWQYDKMKLSKVVFFAFFLTLIPISAYLFFYANELNLIIIVLLIFIVVSQALYLIQESNIISIIQNKLLLKINLIYAVLLFISQAVIIFFIDYSLAKCLFGILLVSVLRNIILYYDQKKIKISEIVQKKIDLLELFWFGINDILQILTKWFDKIILIVIISSADYAIYFNGTYEIPLIGMGLTAFQSIITAYGAKEGEENRQLSLFKQSTSIMACILFPLFAFCFVYASEIITFLFSSAYTESIQLFAISSILLPLRIASYTVLLQLKKMGKIILLGSILDFVVAISMMIFLYPIFSLSGLIASVVFATYIQAAFYVIFICKFYKCNVFDLFEVKYLIVLFVISISALFCTKFLFGGGNIWLSFSFGCFVFLALVLSFLFKKIGFKNTFGNTQK